MTFAGSVPGRPASRNLARLRKVLRDAPMMAWLADANGAVTFVNRKRLTFTGRRLRDELGDGWTQLLHPEDRGPCLAAFRAAVSDRRPMTVEYRIRRVDDVYRRLCDCAFPIYDEHDEIAGFMGTSVDVTAQRESSATPEEEELRASRHRLRDLSAHLESAREEERRQLARTLHDEVGQLLTGIRLEVASAVERFRQIGSPAAFPVVDRLQAAVGLVDLSIATVQRITSALRPPVLEHLGLISAIRWEAAVFERRTGIRCRVSAAPARIESRRHTNILYRILLEALTNVARHANAGTVWITVRQRADQVSMEVRDNGRGISDEALEKPDGMGLLGMRERALAAGGQVRIHRTPAGGTSVTVNLPLDGARARRSAADALDA